VRYVIVGCGAIGGTVAAGLVRDGHDVLVADADAGVVSAINDAGLTITGPVENFTVNVRAVRPADLPDKLDCPVLVAVKAHHTAAAAASLAGRLDGSGYVVSLQNGLNTRTLADAAGASRVVEACVNFGADVTSPGVVLRGNRATFVVGETDGTITDRVTALAADIADAEVTGNVLGYIWAKEAYGAMLAAGAVSDLPIADTLDDPAYRTLMIEIARQVLAQAPVRPVPLDGFDPDDLEGSLTRLAVFNRGSAKSHSGIYRDLAVLHRPTEVTAILGGLASDRAPLISRIIELVTAIEQGHRVCERANLDLLAAYERLDRLGRPLNAVAAVIGAPRRCADGALRGEQVAVKDIVSIAGVPTRCGSPATSDEPAGQDALIVRRLREAGADVFAATQCLEFAAGFAHPQVGDTRNPRDVSRTSGGSSGGSAAVVAAGVCDLAVGTDTGGSIRIPAAYCGIVGLKPTYGLVPVSGVFPLSPRCDHAGTLTSTVAGTARLLAVLAGRPAPASGEARRKRHTVGVLAAQLDDPSVTPLVRQAVRAALGALSDAGWELHDLTGTWLDRLARWEHALGIIVGKEACAVHAGRDTSSYSEGTRALLGFGAGVTQAQFARALDDQAELTAAVDLNLAGVDALVGPTVGYQAPLKDPPFGIGDGNGEGRFTGPYNLTGHPALSLPVPVPAGELPAGIQFAGRRDGDFALLGVAAAAESVFNSMAVPTRKD
jgi:2-dehydropantoate 2-reductase